MNQTWRLESTKLATSCGFQEMPAWSIDPQSLELLRRDKVTLGTGWQTMNSLTKGGSSRVSSILYTSGS